MRLITYLYNTIAVDHLMLLVTLATLIITTYYNRKTHIQSKKQLNQNKRQFTRQLYLAKTQFDEQQKSIRIQQFETTLFNMIELQQEITEGLELRTWKGRIVFRSFYERGPVSYNQGPLMPRQSCKDIIIKKGTEGYEGIDQLHLFDHYFRHLYNIFKFIDDADFLDEGSQYIDER